MYYTFHKVLSILLFSPIRRT